MSYTVKFQFPAAQYHLCPYVLMAGTWGASAGHHILGAGVDIQIIQIDIMANMADMEQAMLHYIQTIEEYKKRKLNFTHFADGWIFAALLQSASNFKIKYSEMIENCTNWTHRLANLKKIVALIEEYFEEQVKKGIKTKDLDLIEIAKNYNVEETLKMFELIIAVLTEAPNKEDHINTIMSLDEKSQGTFVLIIQNLLENRILDKNETKQDRIFETIDHLQMENNLLRAEVESLLKENHQLDKEIEELKHRQADYEDELRKVRDQEIDKNHVLLEEPKEKEHLRNLIENLKQKLISTVRESEVKISGLREEIHILQAKSSKLEETEEQLEDYKRRYNETIESYGKAKLWEREKNKLFRTIEEKEEVIKKLNSKLDEANELNFSMQEREVYAKMELEKRDVRYEELVKEVKKRYGTSSSISSIENPSSSKSLQLSNTNVAVLSQEINQLDMLEIEELKNQIEQLKKKSRESQKQNNKLKRNLEKVSTLESEKKKLERLILDLSNEKREQVEVLLSTTYQFYSENAKLRALLTECGHPV